MARTKIFTETSAWLLQAKDFLVEARRLKPGPARNELRQVAKVLRELAKLEARSNSQGTLIGRREPDQSGRLR
jgi:hypothetical protein